MIWILFKKWKKGEKELSCPDSSPPKDSAQSSPGLSLQGWGWQGLHPMDTCTNLPGGSRWWSTWKNKHHLKQHSEVHSPPWAAERQWWMDGMGSAALWGGGNVVSVGSLPPTGQSWGGKVRFGPVYTSRCAVNAHLHALMFTPPMRGWRGTVLPLPASTVPASNPVAQSPCGHQASQPGRWGPSGHHQHQLLLLGTVTSLGSAWVTAVPPSLRVPSYWRQGQREPLPSPIASHPSRGSACSRAIKLQRSFPTALLRRSSAYTQRRFH